jgi:hypothetical protein
MKHTLTPTPRHMAAYHMCCAEVVMVSTGTMPETGTPRREILRQSLQAISIYITETLHKYMWVDDGRNEYAYLRHYRTHSDVLIAVLDIEANVRTFSATGATQKKITPVL